MMGLRALLPAATRTFALALALAAAAPAWAHTEVQGAGGFAAGLLHPLAGLDHLLAMVAVGIWGAFLGRPLIWALPVAFPMLMVAGGVLGIAGVPLPGVEAGVALSVVLLGAAIAAAWRAPVALAVAVVGLFGVLHGHAHGTELPTSASPAAYATGFVLTTGALHVAGIAFGAVDRWARGRLALRAAGGLMALAGAVMLAGRL